MTEQKKRQGHSMVSPDAARSFLRRRNKAA